MWWAEYSLSKVMNSCPEDRKAILEHIQRLNKELEDENDNETDH